MALRRVTPGLPFDGVLRRVSQMSAIEDGAIRQIREGPEGIGAQFINQGEIGFGGFRPWVPSQRALGLRKGRKRTGGLTLVDTGDYLRAWMGLGSGAIAEAKQVPEGIRVRVGVDHTKFPQVNVFQAEGPVSTGRARIANRPVRLNPGTINRIGQLVLRHAVGD